MLTEVKPVISKRPFYKEVNPTSREEESYSTKWQVLPHKGLMAFKFYKILGHVERDCRMAQGIYFRCGPANYRWKTV